MIYLLYFLPFSEIIEKTSYLITSQKYYYNQKNNDQKNGIY